MIAEVMTRTGVRLSPDDPAFVVVELGRLSFEQAVGEACTRLNGIAPAIDSAARKAAVDITRAALGGISAEAAMARQALDAEADRAVERIKLGTIQAQRAAGEAIARLASAERSVGRRGVATTAVVLALALSFGIFAAGVWVGQRIGAPMPALMAPGR